MGEGSDPTAEREIVTVRELNASPAEVFAAFRQPASLAAWWGPAGFTNVFDAFDFRPGGAWRFTMRGPDGREFRNESRFLEIKAPERIVFHHAGPPHEYWATFEFAERGDGTLLTWRMLHASAAECARLRHLIEPANEQNLDRLEAFLTRSSRPDEG